MVDEYEPDVVPAFDPYGGPNPGGGSQVYGDVRVSLDAHEDSFASPVIHTTSNRLDIPGGYPYNTERHRFEDDGTFIKDIANTDRLTDLGGKFQVTAAANETHTFKTHEIFRYVPNFEALWGVAAWAESDLQAGQHFAVEFLDNAVTDGYRYHFEGTTDGLDLTLEQYRGGTAVDTHTVIESGAFRLDDRPDYDHTTPTVYRGFTNWYGAGITRYEASYPYRDADGDVAGQRNSTLGMTADRDDVATDRINNRIGIRVWADAGASEFTVNVCSMGALIRGDATQFDREKAPMFWRVGGSISQYPTDNLADSMAARIDPTRTEVSVSMLPPAFQPVGSGVHMELSVYKVDSTDPDLTVNFDDPDDDGTDEGPSPAAQAREQNDVMQYTRDVTAIPTTTDIRADGTTGLVPDMTLLSTTYGESGTGGTGGANTGNVRPGIKRNIDPDSVAVFIPRTDPEGSTTNGTMRWFQPVFEEDW